MYSFLTVFLAFIGLYGSEIGKVSWSIMPMMFDALFLAMTITFPIAVLGGLLKLARNKLR